MKFRKLIGFLHLWVGISSGLLVFIISITGCIYVFQDEIKNLTQPYRFVDKQEKDFLLPSVLKKIAEEALPNKLTHSIMYLGKNDAVKVIFYSDSAAYYYIVYINQYTGKVLKVRNEYNDFFRFILDGHFNLWLPVKIGKPIVASVTLLFLFMLFSGIILWWPKNKSAAKQRFSIKWSAKWKRKNYDIHNVLGFYASWIAIFFAITGLVWGFQWFEKGFFKVISGGQNFKEYENPKSVSLAYNTFNLSSLDKIWIKMKTENPNFGSIEIHNPEDKNSSIVVNVNPEVSTYWKIDYRYFNQYTLQELDVNHAWGKFKNLSNADKLLRMNYDIHVGAIFGLPGKLMAFFASLIVASLPITGFMIWMGRKKKSKPHKSLI